MSDVKPNQTTEHRDYNVETTSNTPSQQAVNNLFGQLFYLYNKYIDKPVVSEGREIPKVS